MSIETFSHVLSAALVETLERHTDRLKGDKIYGATLVRTDDNLAPYFAVLADTGPTSDEARLRWDPAEACIALQSERLTEVSALFDAHLDAAPALARALGHETVRRSFVRIGAEPILYIYDESAGTIERSTFVRLNAGRESEPYYVQAASLLA